jgi:hypothetical protein
MPVENWNEAGKTWEDDHGLLDDGQVAKCARADEGALYPSPVPTRMVSNGEYLPAPQTAKQQHVEGRIEELAESASRKLGVDRRSFLAGSGGMAAAFLAMNEVFGHFFDVNPIEMFEPAAYAQAAAPRDLFVFDDQLHMVRGSNRGGGAALRALAQGPSAAPRFAANPFNPRGLKDERGEVWSNWNPALVGLPITDANAQIVQFIKDVFLDSQVTIGLLSNVTASSVTIGGEQRRAPRNVAEALRGEILTAAQTAAARNFVNQISGSTRMMAHGLLYVGKGNLPYIQEQTEQNQPDSWKGYNISNAAKIDDDPNSLMRQWRHDDEEVAYPTFALIEKLYQEGQGQETRLQEHLRAQGPRARTARPATRTSRRYAKGRERLAEPELHHLSRVHSARVLPGRISAGDLRRQAARGRTRHQLDHRIRRQRRTLQELLRGDRHHVGIVDRDLPDGGSAHHGTAHEVHGIGPHRVRLRLRLVRLAAVADRRPVALPDPRGTAQKVWIPRVDAIRQAQNPRTEFRPALRCEARPEG